VYLPMTHHQRGNVCLGHVSAVFLGQQPIKLCIGNAAAGTNSGPRSGHPCAPAQQRSLRFVRVTTPMRPCPGECPLLRMQGRKRYGSCESAENARKPATQHLLCSAPAGHDTTRSWVG
jgi:hypothetical protein